MRLHRRTAFVLFAFGTTFLFGSLAIADDETRFPSGANSQGDESFVLRKGQQRVISARGVQSYSEGTRGVVDVRLTKEGDQFILVGVGVGKTSLLLLMKNGEQRSLEITVELDPLEERAATEAGVPRRENIRLDFYFVELDRSYQHKVGVDPVDALSGPALGGAFDFLSQSFQSATAVVTDQALFRLDIAQTTGMAKLSRKAAVITENNQKSRLEGGGEVNIPLTGSLSTGIHKISYGSTIEVEPHFDPETNRLQIGIAADVSDLTDDRGSGAPGRITSSIRTTVNLELGQAIVLAGLSSHSETHSRAGIPFLSQVPILGLLFGTDSVSRHESDHVVFIVPTVSQAQTAEVRKDIASAFEAFVAFSGDRESKKRIERITEAPDAE